MEGEEQSRESRKGKGEIFRIEKRVLKDLEGCEQIKKERKIRNRRAAEGEEEGSMGC